MAARRQSRASVELWLALLACLLIGAVYAAGAVVSRQVPAAGGWVGHAIGVTGFALMLATETLYSLRKRALSARWGRMSRWLQFHIFTGIVGPFMVLLHSTWRYNGVAGAALLLTGLIVASGFIGRYIYTRVPRTAAGTEDPGWLGQAQAEAILQARRMLALWHTIHIPIGLALFTVAFAHILGALYYAAFLR